MCFMSSRLRQSCTCSSRSTRTTPVPTRPPRRRSSCCANVTVERRRRDDSNRQCATCIRPTSPCSNRPHLPNNVLSSLRHQQILPHQRKWRQEEQQHTKEGNDEEEWQAAAAAAVGGGQLDVAWSECVGNNSFQHDGFEHVGEIVTALSLPRTHEFVDVRLRGRALEEDKRPTSRAILTSTLLRLIRTSPST